MRYASTPRQMLFVGGCPNVHGQAMLQLQTSNQSPATCHCGISAISLPDCFSGPDVLWFPSRLTAAEPAASYSPPAALASISTPQAAKPTPAIRPNQRPIGIVFSKRTKRARPAIQNRFMIPPKKRRLIKNQQQPRQ